jgi:hypothetical protein
MSSKDEDRLQDLLKKAVRSEDAPELTDELVDAFLELPSSCADDSQRRVRDSFIRKMFLTVHPDPVRNVGEQIPFGRWLESVRRTLCLEGSDIAAALGKDEQYLQRIESGEVLPWAVPASDFGNLICLVRVHIDAVVKLVQYTASVDHAKVGAVSARSRGGRMTATRGASAKRALDLYLARNAPSVELNDGVTAWVAALRADLEGRGAGELLT